MRAVVVCLVVLGCGRLRFEPATGGDSAADATCWPAWRDGSVTLSAPREITELSSGFPQADPSPSYDGLTLYYVVAEGNSDLYYATRATTQDPWTGRGPISELDTTSTETKLTVTRDGLTGVYSSDRNGSMNNDLWATTRATAGAQWGAPTQVPVAGLETSRDDYDPHLTPDGSSLYYAPQQPSGGQAIVQTSRATTADPFAIVRTLTELSTPPYSDPTVSPDELVIVFVTGAQADLYMATRTDRLAMFGPVTPVPGVNDPVAHDADSELSPDGCTLYFSSDRTGTKDLYVADVLQ